MHYQSVLFDLDGTLLNTNDLILQTFNYTLKEILGITVPQEQIFATYGRPLQEIMAEFDAERADLLLTTYRAYNAQIHDEYVTLFDQVEETLAALKDNGLKLSVVTSKKSDIAYHGLAHFDLEHYFDAFVGPEDTPGTQARSSAGLRGAETARTARRNCPSWSATAPTTSSAANALAAKQLPYAIRCTPSKIRSTASQLLC